MGILNGGVEISLFPQKFLLQIRPVPRGQRQWKLVRNKKS